MFVHASLRLPEVNLAFIFEPQRSLDTTEMVPLRVLTMNVFMLVAKRMPYILTGDAGEGLMHL